MQNYNIRISSQDAVEILPFRSQVYDELKREHLQKGTLFVDKTFPPDESLFVQQREVNADIEWKRAREIASDAEFILNNATVDDICQGSAGDCWFLAALAAITQVPELFKKIVPEQTFTLGDYAGIFHFRFWIYGSWYDVVVDDYLPVLSDGTLYFCRNDKTPNEFWAALLEKAYAKIYGSYAHLDGGFTADALVDMSGGIQETYNFNRNLNSENETWDVIKKSCDFGSMAAAYIQRERQLALSNGLVTNHAYAIIRLAVLEKESATVKLIKLKNPWGNEVEWNGLWSDDSSAWDSVATDLKEDLKYKNAKDGEFWLSFEDFFANFNNIEFCNLTPDAFGQTSAFSWNVVAYHGEWINGKTAGGSGKMDSAAFWMNPQFRITLDKIESKDECTLIIALMQKHNRSNRFKMPNSENFDDYIQFQIFEITDGKAVEAKMLNLMQLRKLGSSGSHINRREITRRFILPPGDYLIIPSCFDYGHEGEFMLRMFTESSIDEKHVQVIAGNELKTASESPVKLNDVRDIDICETINRKYHVIHHLVLRFPPRVLNECLHKEDHHRSLLFEDFDKITLNFNYKEQPYSCILA